MDRLPIAAQTEAVAFAPPARNGAEQVSAPVALSISQARSMALAGSLRSLATTMTRPSGSSVRSTLLIRPDVSLNSVRPVRS